MKPCFLICRAMFVQNIVRRATQVPALARAISSTAPKPSNLPAREYFCHYQLVSLVVIWLIVAMPKLWNNVNCVVMPGLKIC